jgi:hypothetical protein
LPCSVIAKEQSVEYEVLTAVVVESSIFWDVTPCKKVKLYPQKAVEAYRVVRP